MEYRKRCLFKNTNESTGMDATALEAIYAYMYGTDENKKAGRYRIRITKLTAEDMVSMGMMSEDQSSIPEMVFGIQATLDLWRESVGWLSTLDWVGDPMSSVAQIEKQLNNQIKAFLTGNSLEENFSFDLPIPPKKKKTHQKPPDLKVVDGEKEEPPKKPTEEPDFDWI